MMSLVAIIVGAVLGAVWNGEFGALIGALFGWLLARSFRLEQQIAGLRRSVEALQAARVAVDAISLPPLTLRGRSEPIGLYCIPFKGRIDTR